MPLGSELVQQIRNAIAFRSTTFGQISAIGDDILHEYCRIYFRENHRDFLNACRRLYDGLRYARSIDDFLDSHRDDHVVGEVGKIAIARCIGLEERKSHIYLDQTNSNPEFGKELFGTWYISLAQILTQNVARTEIDTIFDNVTFIVFNYDRCLEYFLVYALARYYDVDVARTRELVSHASIFHPYGTIGPLIGNSAISFGDHPEVDTLQHQATGIRTYTERIEDSGELQSMKSAIASAEVLVFLGFGFHKQNMNLLTPANLAHNKPYLSRVYGTVYGESDDNTREIFRSIREALGPERGNRIQDTTYLLHGTCAQLFRDHWRGLVR